MTLLILSITNCGFAYQTLREIRLDKRGFRRNTSGVPFALLSAFPPISIMLFMWVVKCQRNTQVRWVKDFYAMRSFIADSYWVCR